VLHTLPENNLANNPQSLRVIILGVDFYSLLGYNSTYDDLYETFKSQTTQTHSQAARVAS
jgi:hypothetical protein